MEDYVFSGYTIECYAHNGDYAKTFTFENSRDGAADCMLKYESLWYPVPLYGRIVVYHGNDCIIDDSY